LVERRALEQWYIRTTAYADRLLSDLTALDWPERIKLMQRNWIGRSPGVDVTFRPVGTSSVEELVVFTTRVDTIYGATFIALAPEHPRAAEICSPDHRANVEAYIQVALRRSEIDRMARADQPSGVFTGTRAIHPITSELLPIFVTDYVLGHYGTGAVMGVPAHDVRDHAFARTLGVPIKSVLTSAQADPSALFTGEGTLVHSGPYSGMTSVRAQDEIMRTLEDTGQGKPTVRYRMRDWLVSRQRYWGAPIPIVYCERCGIVPVPEDRLPVLLPDVAQYGPAGTGRSPLESIAEFAHTNCPQCGGHARRETDTLDGFADSNWYFLRFVDPAYGSGPWNPQLVQYWLPVDWYLGGAEHAVMHLLYARFFTKVLADAGLINFGEPFLRLRTQGSMLSPFDGHRMSKSQGNVITPDEVVAQHGADALRVYELFIGPFDQDVTWDAAGMAGAARFVRRLYGLLIRGKNTALREDTPEGADALKACVHHLIKLAGEMIEQFRFNSLVAELMSFLNELETRESQWRGTPLWQDVLGTFIRICAPITPFLAEEVWAKLGYRGSVHLAPWPRYDSQLAKGRDITIVIEVDGRVRGTITVEAEVDQEALIRVAASRESVRRAIGGRTLQRVIVVPGRLVNFVTASPP